MVFMTVLTISILAVAPLVSKIMKREMEEELLFRGKQYANAILAFQKKQGHPPMALDELMKTRPRSARKLFKEPICNCGDWGLIFVGDVWPPPKLKGLTGDTPPGGSPATYSQPPPGKSGQPSTYTQPPTGGSTGKPGKGAGFSDDPFFRDKGKEVSNRPIIGVHSLVHKKGLRTFKGLEYYDEWGFIAGQNNDDTGDLFPGVGAYPKGAPPPRPQPPGMPGKSH
jgi:type II secretory pathway pseudopilin PulG